MSDASTRGIHHIGLTVAKLEESASFFTTVLGWNEARRDEAYPALFVSDGRVMVTLWKNKEEPAIPFDRVRNIGLHHVAFELESEAELKQLYDKLLAHQVEIEFAPELVREGPAKHMICYEPSGLRVEFIWPGA